MCTSLPARVLRVDGRSAEIVSLGRPARALIATDDAVQAGDWVLLQAGLILGVLDREQARDMLQALEEWMALTGEPDDARGRGGDAS